MSAVSFGCEVRASRTSAGRSPLIGQYQTHGLLYKKLGATHRLHSIIFRLDSKSLNSIIVLAYFWLYSKISQIQVNLSRTQHLIHREPLFAQLSWVSYLLTSLTIDAHFHFDKFIFWRDKTLKGNIPNVWDHNSYNSPKTTMQSNISLGNKLANTA